jgi:hypothetical protein
MEIKNQQRTTQITNPTVATYLLIPYFGVGDLSPKGRVGDSRLAPVCRWKLKTNSVQLE